MSRIAIFLWIAMAGTAAGSEPVSPEPSNQAAHECAVAWTDAAPAIDGVMDDECWRGSAQLRFSPPDDLEDERATTVRMRYDAENLYILMEMADSSPETINVGLPEDRRDLVDEKCDRIELLFSPARASDGWFRLCCNPAGARFDEACFPGMEGPGTFNPEWSVVTSLTDSGWCAEMRMPFSELKLPGQYSATPQPGSDWAIRLIRHFGGGRHDCGVWPVSVGNDTQHGTSGTMAFSGCPTGKGGTCPPIIMQSFSGRDGLRPGRNLLRGNVAGAFFVNRYEVRRNGDLMLLPGLSFHDGRSGFSLENGIFEIPVDVTSAGIWSVSIWFYLPGNKVLYRGGIVSNIPSAESLAMMLESARATQGILQGMGQERLHPVTQRFAAFVTDAAGFQKDFAAYTDADQNTWSTLLTRFRTIQSQWNALTFDAFRAREMANCHEPRDFAVVATGPESKLYRREAVDNIWTDGIRVSAAGREYESFQLAVIPFWKKLERVTVSFSDFIGEKGTIASTNVSSTRVEWVRNVLYNRLAEQPHEFEPDMLLPASELTVPEDELGAFWVDVYCPAETPAGDYRGTIRVQAAGQEVLVPVILHAYGFDLPQTCTLRNNHWSTAGAQAAFWNKEYTPEIHEKQAKVAARYRITYFADDTWVLNTPRNLSVWREPSGQYTFDFNKWVPYIRTGLRHGGNWYRASGSCNTAAISWIHAGFPITERSSGKRLTLGDCMPEFFGATPAKERWESPLYRDYLAQLESFLREQGLLGMSYYEMFDEAGHDLKNWRDMVAHHELVAQVAPGLISMQYGPRPLAQQYGGVKPLGYCDNWAPNLCTALRGQFGPSGEELWNTIKARRTQFGEKAFFYSPGGSLNPTLSGPRLTARLLPWVARKLDADGFLLYMLGGVQETPRKRELSAYWPNTAWADTSDGIHSKIYIDPEMNLIPSTRLANLRDGNEDYDYFTVLRKAGSYLDPEIPEQAQLLQRIAGELAVEDAIYASPDTWTKSRRLLEEKRDRMAAMINEVRALRMSRLESLESQVEKAGN